MNTFVKKFLAAILAISIFPFAFADTAENMAMQMNAYVDTSTPPERLEHIFKQGILKKGTIVEIPVAVKEGESAQVVKVEVVSNNPCARKISVGQQSIELQKFDEQNTTRGCGIGVKNLKKFNILTKAIQISYYEVVRNFRKPDDLKCYLKHNKRYYKKTGRWRMFGYDKSGLDCSATVEETNDCVKIYVNIAQISIMWDTAGDMLPKSPNVPTFKLTQP